MFFNAQNAFSKKKVPVEIYGQTHQEIIRSQEVLARNATHKIPSEKAVRAQDRIDNISIPVEKDRIDKKTDLTFQ